MLFLASECCLYNTWLHKLTLETQELKTNFESLSFEQTCTLRCLIKNPPFINFTKIRTPLGPYKDPPFIKFENFQFPPPPQNQEITPLFTTYFDILILFVLKTPTYLPYFSFRAFILLIRRFWGVLYYFLEIPPPFIETPPFINFAIL